MINWTKNEENNELRAWPFVIRIDDYGAANLYVIGANATRNKKDIQELKDKAEAFLQDILDRYAT
jgi:hypothetical protein